jgi:hypothetical protein
MATIVDHLYADNLTLLAYLNKSGEISLASTVNESFPKALVLSAASYFESFIQDAIVRVVAECTGPANALLEFVKNKAIERQYHTYFQWDRSNANSFFGLFGSEFRDFMVAQVKASPQLASSIAAFLELGNIRNQLVHQNFAVFPLQKTAEEIFGLYETALLFVQAFPEQLEQYCARAQNAEANDGG